LKKPKKEAPYFLNRMLTYLVVNPLKQPAINLFNTLYKTSRYLTINLKNPLV